MRIRIGAFVAVAALVAASAARADDAAMKDGWTSFKPGSSVTMKSTTKMSMPGMPEQPPQESRTTLVSVTDKEYVLKAEMKMGDTWSGQEMTMPRKAEAVGTDVKPPPEEDLGEEKVSVEGTDYVCKKKKSTQNGATTTLWVHKEHGTLKVETSGPGDVKSTTITTALAKKTTVAGKELTCRETKTTSSMAGNESTAVFLSSEAVPGGMVHMESNMTGPGMTMSTVTEVTAFEAK